MTPESAALMAEYNRWMNDRLYEAAAKLDPAELAADKGAFFGSILSTLNHIAVGDTIWLQRFAGHEAAFPALRALGDFPRPGSLTQPLAADLPGLRRYRQDLDGIIERWVKELRPEHLSTQLTYASLAGARSSRSFGGVLQHFFNHQTHHRGQVTTLLFQSGVDVGVTDLLVLVPNSEG